MRKLTICALLFCLNLLLLPNLCKAQSKFWKNVTVRKAFETKTEDDKKPATISFTFPKDTSNSYLINAGVGYDFFESKKERSVVKSATGFFVYNRNTLVDKKTKNYKLGITAGHVIDINDAPTTAVFGATSVQYLKNFIDTTHSLITTTYWHPMYKSPKFIPIGGYMKNSSHLIDYFVLPQAGLEYQKIFDANLKNREGYDARVYFNTTLNIRVKKKTRYNADQIKQHKIDSLSGLEDWKKKPLAEVKKYVDDQVLEGTTEPVPKKSWSPLLEFSFSYTGRSSFANDNSNFEKYIPLFTAGLNIYPFNNENFSFGISYNDGANPIDGTPKQTFWLFSVNFKK